MHAITTAEPPDLMGAGPLADAVHGLLAKDPRHRLDTAGCRWFLRSATQDPDSTTVNPRRVTGGPVGAAPTTPTGLTAHMSGAVPEHLTPVHPTTPYLNPNPQPTPTPSPNSGPNPTPQPGPTPPPRFGPAATSPPGP